MENKKEFFLNLNDSALKKEIAEHLGKLSNGISVIDHPVENPNFIIVDAHNIEKYDEAFLRQHGEKIILLSELSDEHNILNYIAKYPINHLIGINGNNVILELENTINKILSSQIWGLKQYMHPMTQITTEGISDSRQIDGVIQKALGKIDYSAYFESPLNYLQVMSNELLTNALYNGIAHRNIINVKEGIDRKKEVFLKGSEHILFSVAADEFAVGISVQDSFGKLDRDKVVASLKRSFIEKTAQEKEGGAGLGLYMIFNHSNQFILNTKKNKRTEVIAIIDSNRRFKKYRERITSFHYYEEVSS